MKILLIGGSGQLGSEIRGRWTEDTVAAPSHDEVAVEDVSSVRNAIDRMAPDIVINCAAFHHVDQCEREPERAFAINALAADAIASLCQERDLRFVTISTDYVFDGRTDRPYVEDDCANPISVYGASKRAGESLVLRRGMKAFVIRTCGVYGVAGSRSKGTFIDRIIAQARAGEAIRVVSDVTVSPTYAGDLAQAMRALIATDAFGLYHACNTGYVTWYDFASTALKFAGLVSNVEPVSASEWKADAPRPAYSALANSKLRALGVFMPDWTSGIRSYLRDAGVL